MIKIIRSVEHEKDLCGLKLRDLFSQSGDRTSVVRRYAWQIHELNLWILLEAGIRRPDTIHWNSENLPMNA